MADENGGPGDRGAAPVARWLKKLPSMLSSSSILENLTFISPPVPPPIFPHRPTTSLPNYNQNLKLQVQDTPPVISISTPTPNLHPIIETMREQELGKLVINLAVPVAIALLLSGNGNSQKLLVAHFILVGLMTGCMAIWNGILFRKTFPRLANVVEQFGISLVLLSLYGLVASFLPKGFSWLCWLCGGLSLLPFIISLLSYVK